jgi:DNA-binding PucR family transcriptional regulator
MQAIMADAASIEFLQLLAREAAPVEFEGPLIRARAAGLAAAELARLEEAKLAALRVRGLLERRKRREEELSGLFDTASDLAGLRDLDAVLRAIVRRARTLLGTDVAYMTLNDDDRGDTYMRVTDGSASARFQALRLNMGVGLGGLVAQTGAPYATADYPADARFRHEREIDAGVDEEGLIAILGVPLRLGARVIGVLYAADRSTRTFAPEDISLLVSLAAHAAIAIDTARLLGETRAALQELSTANRLIQAHSDSVERAAAAHDRMTALVLRGGGVEDVAAAVTEVLGGALLVYDADGRELTAVGELSKASQALVAEAVTAARAERRAIRRGDCWVAPVGAGIEDLGALVLQPREPLADADQRILERAALVTALLLLFRRSVAEAEGRVRGELLDDLIARPVRDPEALRTRASRLGVNIECDDVLVVVDAEQLTGPVRQRAASWAASYATMHSGLAASRDQRVVLLIPGTDPGKVAREVSRDLAKALGRPVTAGAAGPTRGPEGISAGYRDADRAVAGLLALGRIGEAASTAELGFVGLLLAETRDVDGYLAATIGPVVEYDARRGTALVQTLEAYFGCGGGLGKAAEILHVHVNTVTQRLDRIAQLLGSDWQRPERALELQLALRLHRLRGSLPV